MLDHMYHRHKHTHTHAHAHAHMHIHTMSHIPLIHTCMNRQIHVPVYILHTTGAHADKVKHCIGWMDKYKFY